MPAPMMTTCLGGVNMVDDAESLIRSVYERDVKPPFDRVEPDGKSLSK